MNPFRAVIAKLSLTAESQGDYGWAFLTLSKLADLDDLNHVSPAYPTNPARSVLAALLPYLTTSAGQRLSQILNTISDHPEH